MTDFKIYLKILTKNKIKRTIFDEHLIDVECIFLLTTVSLVAIALGIISIVQNYTIFTLNIIHFLFIIVGQAEPHGVLCVMAPSQGRQNVCVARGSLIEPTGCSLNLVFA